MTDPVDEYELERQKRLRQGTPDEESLRQQGYVPINEPEPYKRTMYDRVVEGEPEAVREYNERVINYNAWGIVLGIIGTIIALILIL